MAAKPISERVANVEARQGDFDRWITGVAGQVERHHRQ